MKNKYLIISCAIIFCILLILFSCKPGTITSSSEDKQKITGPAETKETSETIEITAISDIKTEDQGKKFTVMGKIKFMDRPSEGLFLEIEDESGSIGIFIENRLLDSISEEKLESIQKGKTIKVSGTLKKPQERLILFIEDASLIEIIAEEKSPDEKAVSIIIQSPDEYQLDVETVYSGNRDKPGLCYLGAFSMLIKYQEPEMNFYDIVAVSGIGTNAGFVEIDNSVHLGNGIGEACIIHAAKNLNTSFTLGLEDGGNDSAPYYPSRLRFGSQAKEVIHFNSAIDPFEYLKYLISSGKPVMIYIDCYYLYDDFAMTSDFWKNNMEKDHYDHYMVVTGYDTDNIYLNDPTDPTEAAADLPAKIENFMQAWENGGSIAQQLGPFWMLYLSGMVSPEPFNEIISWNTDISKNSVSEIRKFAGNPNSSESTCFLLNELGRARIEFSNYLDKNGMTEPAVLYKQSGEIFSEIAFDMSVTTEKLNLIIDKESEAMQMLAEK